MTKENMKIPTLIYRRECTGNLSKDVFICCTLRNLTYEKMHVLHVSVKVCKKETDKLVGSTTFEYTNHCR